MEKTTENENKPALFTLGGPGGPGRPADTPEQKIVKRAVKALLKEYEETLSDALPELSPVLIAEAKKGNIKAFGEIHKVIGAHKDGPSAVVPIQINLNADTKDPQLVELAKEYEEKLKQTIQNGQ